MSDTTSETLTTEQLTERLAQGAKIVEAEAKSRREREVKGSHLLEPMLAALRAEPTLHVEEKTGFFKATLVGSKGNVINVARKGGRVDFCGFTVDSPALVQVSKEDAKARHLGKVQAQMDFTKTDEEVMTAFNAGIAILLVPIPGSVKPPRKPKVDKVVEEVQPETVAEVVAEVPTV